MRKVVIISLIIIYILFFGIYYLLEYSYNSFDIIGDSFVVVDYNSKYEDKGAKSKLFNKKIKTINNVDTSIVGDYEVIYELSFLKKYIKIRKVKVVDNNDPLIELIGEDNVVLCPNKKYEEEGYKAYDEYDGDLTDKVVITSEDNKIKYSVFDSSNNSFSIERKILYEDKESPVIELKGSNSVIVYLNSTYKDKGATIRDNCDNDIELVVDNNVDTTKEGTYYVTYSAIDESGNKSEIKRKVVVKEKKVEEPQKQLNYSNSSGVVYLTFDDGPSGSGSTAKILDVLKKYNAKATFFVTCNGPDSLIKREYNEGHTVALHTKTHTYSVVYSSVDNYYKDLNAVSDRVYNITGKRSKIIRFPGGSNNTVSNKYNKGIMNVLVKDVVKNGYSYYDWNVSSGDAGGCTTASCVYNNVTKRLSKKQRNIVLMHDIKKFTANAVEDIVLYCIRNGYQLKPLDISVEPVRFLK